VVSGAGYVGAPAGNKTGTAAITGLGIGKVRNDSAITYSFAASGFSFAAQTAEGTDTLNTWAKRPLNFSLGYAAGPASLTVAYDRNGNAAKATEAVTSVNGAYDFGVVKLGAFVARGTMANDTSRKSWMLTAVSPIGQGEVRAAVAQRTDDSVKVTKLLALGYHYALSKRTTIYTDFVRNGSLTTNKTGYDFGLKHNF
jgi:predicted porin